jgi:phosphoadenosine phosphosulfate reductase
MTDQPILFHHDDAHGASGWVQSSNAHLESLDAQARVARALEHLPSAHVLSSGFGVQAAVMLHPVTRVIPRIPVILIDTGYLFPETYRFVDTLADRLDLDLRVYRNDISPAWLETRTVDSGKAAARASSTTIGSTRSRPYSVP